MADELRHALAFSEEFGDSDQFRSIEDWEQSLEGLKSGDGFADYIYRESRGLIEIYPSSGAQAIVRFYHESVAEFLCTEAALTILGENTQTDLINRCHLVLLRVCLNALNFCKFRGEESMKFADYACGNWVYHARKCGDLLHTLNKPFYFLEDCAGSKASRIIEKQIQKLKEASAKEWFLLENEKTLLVLLATLGCTNLLQHHLKNCSACTDACAEYNNEPGLYGKALHNAIISGWTTTAKWMLQTHCGGDINALYNDSTLLYKACYFGHRDVAAFLLANGASATTQCFQYYEYALHCAIELGHEHIVKELLQSQHTVTHDLLKVCREADGYTPFHTAVGSYQPRDRKLPVLMALIRYAPKGTGLLEIVDLQGDTPVTLARRLKEEGEHGADEIEEELEYFITADRKVANEKQTITAKVMEVSDAAISTLSLLENGSR